MTNTSSLVSLTKEPTPNKPVKFTDDIDCERFGDVMKLFSDSLLPIVC